VIFPRGPSREGKAGSGTEGVAFRPRHAMISPRRKRHPERVACTPRGKEEKEKIGRLRGMDTERTRGEQRDLEEEGRKKKNSEGGRGGKEGNRSRPGACPPHRRAEEGIITVVQEKKKKKEPSILDYARRGKGKRYGVCRKGLSVVEGVRTPRERKRGQHRAAVSERKEG